jgi:hypothetical protein
LLAIARLIAFSVLSETLKILLGFVASLIRVFKFLLGFVASLISLVKISMAFLNI